MKASVRRHSKFLLFGLLAFGFSLGSLGQQSVSTRKLIGRTAPQYPELARSMALQGTVKVEAVVAPDGTVRSVEIKGGHPVLAQAAANTVRRWKWEAAPHESHELVEVKFAPE
jgi:TonB family protein